MPVSKSRSTRISKGEESRLSMAMENYLLSILRLGEQGVRVTLTQLAEHFKILPVDEGLGTSLPSVGGMIRRMAKEGLVELTPNKEVVLTPKGMPHAEGILRRHRLAERLVVDILGLELQKAHQEAHRLEHAMSPEVERLIIEKLGNPKTCPFGHPIPGSGYTIEKDVISLDQAQSGKQAIIHSIPEDDQSLLDYFVENNLIPGQLIDVKEVSLPRRIISLQCGESEVVFSYDVGTQIKVRPYDEN